MDLWAGYADVARTRPWERDTIVLVASCTKGVTGLCANMLADRGLLDFDTAVATYWPEFARNGKAGVLVRWLLDHRAGLADMADRPAEDYLDWNSVTGRLADQRPAWVPGTAFSYHAMNYGYLVGEVVRRILGQTIGTFLRQEVCVPLGIDFYIGVPPEADAQCAEFANDPSGPIVPALNPSDPMKWRRAEMPAGNGHTNARGMARIYGALALGGEIDGVRLISRDQIELATSYTVTRPWASPEARNIGDIPAGAQVRFGAGFMLNCDPINYMGPNPDAFGYGGFGGALGFADMDAGLSFAFTPNQRLGTIKPRDSRSGLLIDAAYASL